VPVDESVNETVSGAAPVIGVQPNAAPGRDSILSTVVSLLTVSSEFETMQ